MNTRESHVPVDVMGSSPQSAENVGLTDLDSGTSTVSRKYALAGLLLLNGDHLQSWDLLEMAAVESDYRVALLNRRSTD